MQLHANRRVVGALLGALAVATAGAGLVACDPTTGRPPAAHEAAPAYRSHITTVTTEELGSSWRPGCPVGAAQLRRLRIDYWGYDGERHRGDLIVRADVAPTLAKVFERIYAARFQIRRIHPVTRYGSSDDASMEANNTSAFNCRRVTGGSSWSEHAYGTAIDINPVQNPYVSRSGTVLPESGRPWADRSLRVSGMIHRGGAVHRAFTDVGWYWGGDWTNPKDYQHLSLRNR